MKQYKIEVHSTGYEDFSMVVVEPTLQKAKQHLLRAKIEWCKHNDVDEDTIELPFTRIVPVD